jgi:hypothetical protein
VRDTWDAGGKDRPTLVVMQLGQPQGSHAHCEGGTFQILRNDRWLTRETPGRSVAYAGPDGVTQVPDMSIWAHNGLTVNDAPYGPYCAEKPAPRVLRLQSHPEFAYAAVDLSSYAAIPATPVIIREFVYVRGLNALVVFDRVQSAEDASKTFLAHVPAPPAISGNVFSSPSGSEELRLVSLTSAIPSQKVVSTVVDESKAGKGSSGTWQPQYRLQITARGPARGYHLNVLQAKSAGDPDVIPELTGTGGAFSVVLRMKGRADVTVTFEQGMSSTGGSYRVGASATPFSERVQPIRVSESGVAWE